MHWLMDKLTDVVVWVLIVTAGLIALAVWGGEVIEL